VQVCLTWCGKDRQALFSGGTKGGIYAWDIDIMEEVLYMGPPQQETITRRAWQRDEKDPLWRLRGSKEFHTEAITQLLELDGLDLIASCSMDTNILLWDLGSGELKRALSGHRKGVRCIEYSSQHRVLVSGGFECDIFVWNPYVSDLIIKLTGHTSHIVGLQMVQGTNTHDRQAQEHRRQTQLLTADAGGVVKVWDIGTFACTQTIVLDQKKSSNQTGEDAAAKRTTETQAGSGQNDSGEKQNQISNVVSLAEEKALLVVGKCLHRFDLERLDNPTLTDDAPILRALFNRTSLTICTVTNSGAVKIWDVQTGRLLRVHKALEGAWGEHSEFTSACLDGRQRKFILSDQFGHVEVYDFLNGEHMKSFAYAVDEPGQLSRPHAPRGRQTTKQAAGRPNGRTRTARPRGRQTDGLVSEKEDRRAVKHGVCSMCYCDEHKILVTGSFDGEVHVHDEFPAENGTLLRTLTGTVVVDSFSGCFVVHAVVCLASSFPRTSACKLLR